MSTLARKSKFLQFFAKIFLKLKHSRNSPDIYDDVLRENLGLGPIGFPVVPTLIFDTTKAKALYLKGDLRTRRVFF